MRRKNSLAAATALTLTAWGLCPASPALGQPTDDITPLLRSVQIDPRDVGVYAPDLAVFVGTRPRSELTQLLMTEPLRADALGHVVAGLLHVPNPPKPEQQTTPVDLLAALARFNTRTVRRGLIGDPLAKYRANAAKPDALSAALFELGCPGIAGAHPDELPDSVRHSAALLLLTAGDAAAWVRRAREQSNESAENWRKLEDLAAAPFKPGEDNEGEDPDRDLVQKRLVETFASQMVMVAAQDLAFATMAAVDILRKNPPAADARFNLRFPTRLGLVVLADAADTQHDYTEPVLLIIDVGGNDAYTNAGANADFTHPVSIAIDLAGNDTYRAKENQLGSFGSGTFGVGMLWDDAGDDTYTADRRSQGSGYFGVGVLVDRAGNDSYHAFEASQAAATAGYGLLLDEAGDDRYEAYSVSQAYAGPNAAAALIDRAGNDKYIANDEDIRYPSAQSDKHNNSMCQAAGNGWRADYLDGISINGGFAVLLDADGDDAYSCGVFGQGVGYWYGLGMLIDLAGKDSYLGQWYVQGASAHFAAGLLLDRGGDDSYTAHMNMSQGAAHDVGIGVFVDDAGNDTYAGSTLGLGASNAAGVGVFIEKTGDDTYQTPAGSCLGWVNANDGYRSLFRSYGLFFDLAGHDTYTGRGDQPGRADAGDGKQWRTPPDRNARVPYLFGFAFDR